MRVAALLAIGAALLAACTPGALRKPSAAGVRAPYPQSRLIRAVAWDFADMPRQRKALGSDLWPCGWGADDALYCAWGDGGGFDGNDDHIGRASLGFARITGVPGVGRPGAIAGRNVWGSPPYAEAPANFGGKVGSVIEVNRVLYANGGFWTAEDTPDPVHKSGRGPRSTVAWSTDEGHTWRLADWTTAQPLGSFLDPGRDTPGMVPPFVYLYYQRPGDDRHLYLERVRSDLLAVDPRIGESVEYFSGARFRGAHWSARESDARAVFADRNHVEGPTGVYDAALGRYLLTVGHYASGNDDDSSAGQVGMFEAPQPWGPWSTVGYYEDWGGLRAETTGDFLSLRIPSKWISADGRSVWAVFSGLKSFDSFNLVHGTFELR
jgi:hypothetical protein